MLSEQGVPPWVRLRTLLDLEGRSAADGETAAAREATLADPRVRQLLADVTRWPGTVLNSHRSASQSFHTLEFLSELLAGSGPPPAEVGIALDRILESMGADGIPRLPMTYSATHGGPGVEMNAWALCDAPTLLLSLVRFGRGADPRVCAGIRALSALIRDNGWPCAVSPELSFRGPGRKDDPCPYATLIMLRLLAASGACGACGGEAAAAASAAATAAGAESLLDCWARSRERSPYLFRMGTDFRKLKAPFLWYDILHVAEVLSLFPAVRLDSRFLEMVGLIRSRRTADGSYLAESVYAPYKEWDFGQKKAPSPWIGFLVRRLEKRLVS
ncbi:MAG: hypothetical protein A2Z99_13800 [Treponema sp. GWB1_62_6]|nr:MAG: hypothetical protein A2Z99_13800 [Treponema sp. GWB1_62_6]OHE68595.1 MAG: hypothetical protein A2001_05675 [Treponema sp. GWC1_61_84]HCM26532.1 hypothetical protein [Treponema sp.]